MLVCNKNKYENISTDLKIEEGIELCELEIDEIRIKQILLNFISNAVKFTKEGEIVLKCKKITMDEKLYIKIYIKDTRIGILKDE